MSTRYYAVRTRPSVQEPLLIGQSSCDLKFLFRDQDRKYSDPPVVWHTYQQILSWLKEYVCDKKEFQIMNEYDEFIDFSEFVELVQIKQQQSKDNPRNFHNAKDIDGYRFTDELY